jgi:hypothetical protein
MQGPHLRDQHPKLLKPPEQRMCPMVFLPRAHRLFDKPVRLNSLHRVCRARMESTDRVIHHSSGQTKDQAGQLLLHQYNASHRPRINSKTILAPISTRDVCLHQLPTPPLLLDPLYSRTNTSLL